MVPLLLFTQGTPFVQETLVGGSGAPFRCPLCSSHQSAVALLPSTIVLHSFVALTRAESLSFSSNFRRSAPVHPRLPPRRQFSTAQCKARVETWHSSLPFHIVFSSSPWCFSRSSSRSNSDKTILCSTTGPFDPFSCFPTHKGLRILLAQSMTPCILQSDFSPFFIRRT